MALGKYADLSKEELIRLLEAREQRARFGLVWEANEIERDRALNSDFVALDLDPALSCPPSSGGEAGWRNLLIEGDNFDALRALRMSFAGQVKCIYIDPPYNTGNRDFVYNDRFVDKEDAWRHSKWCEFMFQRLMLARDLLRQDGVIFVSIDDIEVAALRMLLNRIFGDGNFLGSIVWKNVTDNNPTRISAEHEYILCFALSESALEKVWKSTSLPLKERLAVLSEELKAAHTDLEERQRAYSSWFRKNRAFMGPLDRYKYIDDGGVYTGSQSVHNPGKEGYRYDVLHPVTHKACAEPLMGYRFPKSTMDKLLNEGRILFGDDHTKIIELKLYAADYKAKLPSVIEMDTRLGANELAEIFHDEKKVFSFSKPSGLIKELLSFATGPDDLVLDFFAGSGTTAHAVHKLNAEDGGRRRVILVSSTEATEDAPEKNLCRDVCATRVRRVIEGYTTASGEAVAGVGGDFAYLRARRIPVGEMLEINHAEVWTAVQLAHGAALTPFAEGPWMLAGDEDEAVCYVPRFDRADAPALRAALRGSRSVALYSWQPATVRQHLRAAHITHLPIPETLARRFGLLQGGRR